MQAAEGLPHREEYGIEAGEFIEVDLVGRLASESSFHVNEDNGHPSQLVSDTTY
jgi:hypothetical protein